jgi:hypothetical protein
VLATGSGTAVVGPQQTEIPEPASLAAWAVALGGVLLVRRLSRRG